MTEITATRNGQHYCLEAHNHAATTEVCAGVSALLYALEGSLFNCDGVICHYSRMVSGEAKIEYIATDPEAKACMHVVLIGLMQIEKAHPDEIKISQNFFETMHLGED